LSLKTWRGLAGRDVTNRQIATALSLADGSARKVITGVARVGRDRETAELLLSGIPRQPASAREYLQGLADGREPERLAEIEAQARSESPPRNEKAPNQVEACQQPKSTKPDEQISAVESESLRPRWNSHEERDVDELVREIQSLQSREMSYDDRLYHWEQMQDVRLPHVKGYLDRARAELESTYEKCLGISLATEERLEHLERLESLSEEQRKERRHQRAIDSRGKAVLTGLAQRRAHYEGLASILDSVRTEIQNQLDAL
jgi:hypothetical protein